MATVNETRISPSPFRSDGNTNNNKTLPPFFDELTLEDENDTNDNNNFKLQKLRSEIKYKNNVIRLKNWLGQNHKLALTVSICIILASIVFAAVGAAHIKGFLSHTTEILDPPAGTDAYEANQAFKSWMPSAAEVSYFNVFVTFKGTYFSLDYNTSNNNNNNITAIPTLCSFLKALEINLQSNPKTMRHYQHMGDFCQLIQMSMFKIGDHLISPDKNSVTAPITCNASRFDPAAKLFSEGLEEIVAQTVVPYLLNASMFKETHLWSYVPKESDFVVGINGLSTFLTSIAETSKKDLIAAMSVVMPILLVLVILRFRGSLGLTFVSLFVAGGHFCSSFGIMRPIDNSMEVSSPTPLLMFCLGIGLSLMFAIVVLTQFSKRSREYFDPLLILMKKGRNNNHTNISTTSKKIAKLYSTTESIVIVGQEESVDTNMKTRLHYSIVTTPIPTTVSLGENAAEQTVTTAATATGKINQNNNTKKRQNPKSSASEAEDEEDVAEREFDSILEEDVNFDDAILSDICLAVKSNWPAQYHSYHHYYHCNTTPNYSTKNIGLGKGINNNNKKSNNNASSTNNNKESRVPTLQNLPSSIVTTNATLNDANIIIAQSQNNNKNNKQYQDQQQQQEEPSNSSLLSLLQYSSRKITNVEHSGCDILVDVFAATAPAITTASVTLLCSICVTVFFPATIIQSLGIGCMMTILASWLYSVPILFCILYAGFPFFVACSYPTGVWYKFSGFLRSYFMPVCLFGEGQCWSCALGCDDYAVGIDNADDDDDDVTRVEKNNNNNNVKNGKSNFNIKHDKIDDDDDDDDDAKTPMSGEHSPLLSSDGTKSSSTTKNQTHLHNNNKSKSNNHNICSQNRNVMINNASSTNYLQSTSTSNYGATTPSENASTASMVNNNGDDDDDDDYDNDDENNESKSKTNKTSQQEQASPTYSNYSSMANETLHRERTSLLRHGKQLLRLLLLGALVASFIFVTTRMTLSNSYIAYLGRHSTVTIDFLSFVDNYGYGMTSPYRILFTVTKDDSKFLWTNESIKTVWSKTFWVGAQQVVSRILDDPVLGNQTHMAGPLVIGPVLQDFQIAWDCIVHKNGCDDDSILAFLGSQISGDSEAMFLMMTARFDPLGRDGWDMYQRILSKLGPESNDFQKNNNGTEVKNLNGPHRVFDVYLEGSGPSSLDCVHAIYDRVPYLAPIAVCVGMLIIYFFASARRSVLNALRFALGLTACLSATLALPTLVYQYGWLDWTSIETLKSIGDIPWIMPLIVFAVGLGLCTAFDVLWVMMLCQKRKFHESGGMYFLGLVVFVAMFGLSMSDVPLMNAVGFSCCTAVIFGSVIVPNALTIPLYQEYGRFIK